MSREDEAAFVRDQASMLAEQVARLLDVISVRAKTGRDTGSAEEKLALLESLMWKLHHRHTRLRMQAAQAGADEVSPIA